MKIFVMSEKQINKYECDIPHAVISIRSPDRLGRTYIPKNNQRKGLMRLEFHDITEEPGDMDGLLEMFSIDHAKRIKQFVLKHKELPVLIVNCEMGISRSSGVAAAISKYLTNDDAFYYQNYIPNRRVYKILLEELMKEDELPT